MKKFALALALLFVFSASVSEATTYYVRKDGLDAHTGTTNTAGGAWLTIAKGCQTAVAGDTVRVQAGTYVEVVSGCTSGSSGNTVTLVADGSVTTCGLSFTSKNYIRVVGLTVDPSTGGCSSGVGVNGSGTNTGLEFWNVTVQNTGGNKAYSFDFSTPARCDKCIWIGGGVNTVGNPASLVAFTLNGDDNFVGYLDLHTIDYVGISPGGARGRIVNANFGDMLATGAAHPDAIYVTTSNTEGFTNWVVESEFNIGTPALSNNKFHHQQNQNTPVWSDNIYRLAVAFNLGGGVLSLYNDPGAGGNLRTRAYHNTIAQPERAQSTNGCQTIGSGATTSLYEYNELFYQCQSAGVTTNIAVWGFGSGTNSANLFADYNLSFDPAATDTFIAPWTSQTHRQSNVDPKLVDPTSATYDFHLGAGSGAIGVGGPLTTASGAGVSSTSLTVATNGGGFFVGDNSGNLAQYGGNLAPGDFVTVGTTPVQVSSISGDVLTLASAISWNNGDPVYFGSSSTIDIGAYPYKATGYTLTASSQANGGTETITPNDASLVRFVVCYNDSVPYTVVNSSPYTCAVPSGAFSARVYPRYASQTQYVTASVAGVGSITLSALKKKVRKD